MAAGARDGGGDWAYETAGGRTEFPGPTGSFTA
ncbi:hypothetical protein SAMN05421671_2721 [Pimelobacter simplex]|nr:hypothetical protein SAMN05421671_2721 [Pimelobacter simplex]